MSWSGWMSLAENRQLVVCGLAAVGLLLVVNLAGAVRRDRTARLRRELARAEDQVRAAFGGGERGDAVIQAFRRRGPDTGGRP